MRTELDLLHMLMAQLAGLYRKIWQTIGWGPKYGSTAVQPSSTQLEIIARLVTEGKLKPVIDRVLPIEQVQ